MPVPADKGDHQGPRSRLQKSTATQLKSIDSRFNSRGSEPDSTLA